MKRTHTVYEELVYGDQENGSCHWVGRLYHVARQVPKEEGEVVSQLAEDISGIAPNRGEALKAFRAWLDVEMPKYKKPEPPELMVITTADVGKLEL